MPEEQKIAEDSAAESSENEQIDLSGDKGAMKEVLVAGTGEEQPTDGCKVLCHYTGKLTNGTQFDSSVGREPFEFELGKGSVIKGFELAAASMKKGEKSRFTFAPTYAYGAHGSPPNIPGDSTLIFEMEMLNWKPQDLSPNSDGGILRHVLKKSDKLKSPAEGALVQAHIIGSYEGRVFDERDVEFDLGEVPDDEIISGVQTALLHFGKDETSRLIIQPRYAFGAAGRKEWDIPPNATVEYTVTLNSFEKDLKSWKLNEEESLEQAKLYKEKGTNFFGKDKYELAIKIYKKSNSFLSNCNNDESQKLKAAVFLNIALCYQKMNDQFEVKNSCNTVLEIDPNNIKALYRRGTSCLKSGETDAALTDFSKIKELEPTNKAAISQIAACRKIIKEAHEKDKKLYANMFAKFATVDVESSN